MKKKLSVLLIGSLVAISLAGCSGNNETSTTVNTDSSADTTAQSSVQSAENTESSVASATEKSDVSVSEDSVQESTESTVTEESEIEGPEEGDIVLTEDGSEIILHEDDFIIDDGDDTNIDEESMEIISDGSEALPKYLDVTFTPIDGKDSNIDANSIDMSKPVYYTVANTQELKDFVSQYDKQYSLNDVESGIPFNQLTEKFDDTYFEYMELVIIPAKYDKDTDPDIGEITVADNNYNIQVCTQPPASADKANCICLVVQANKSELGDRNIVLTVVEDDMIVEGEEEI